MVGDSSTGRRHRPHRALIVGLVLSVLAVVAGAPAMAMAMAQTDTGFLSIVNGSSDAIDVYIDEQLAGVRLQPNDLSREFSVPAGPHTIEIYPAGSAERDANRLAETDTDVPVGAGVTVVAFGDAEAGPAVALQTFPNPGSIDADESCLLLRHVARAGTTRLLVDGEPMGDAVGPGTSTRPIVVPPGLVDLGLEGLDTTPARADLEPGSCVAVHALGNAGVIVTLAAQPLAPRGTVETAEPEPAGPAELTVVNALRGLTVEFHDARSSTELEPLSAIVTATPTGSLVARFADLDDNTVAESAMTIAATSQLTVALHNSGGNGDPAITVFDDVELVADEGLACVDVRILAGATPVDVTIGDEPNRAGLTMGDATGPIQTRPGDTEVSASSADGTTTKTIVLDEGSCTVAYLVDTADGPRLAGLDDLRAGLAADVEPDVAGTQTTLPVTGSGDAALPAVLFALGVIVFGFGLSQRARERVNLEQALARISQRS